MARVKYQATLKAKIGDNQEAKKREIAIFDDPDAATKAVEATVERHNHAEEGFATGIVWWGDVKPGVYDFDMSDPYKGKAFFNTTDTSHGYAAFIQGKWQGPGLK